MLSVNKIHHFWQKRNLFNYLLLPISLLWEFASTVRKLQPSYKSSLFVICVGNLNVGGAGKTPTAILVGELLQQHHQVVFLTKGYKGSLHNPTWITSQHTALEAGDEALLLAKTLTTMVAKNLKAGLQAIEKSNKATIVILDDGYQNPTIIKDFYLLVVNGTYQFGNKFLLPAGPLRERIPMGLKKAHAMIILEANPIPLQKLATTYKINTYRGSYQPVTKFNVNGEVLAFCGIGMPEKFLQTLKNHDIKVAKFLTYPDHHKYTPEDLQHIILTANNLSILTTEKDYVKIPLEYRALITSYSIKLHLSNQNTLLNQILAKIP